jgi:large subunit ribosomal protein L31
MKKNTHPKYQKVLFVDSASGYKFVCGSTLKTEAKEVFEGVEYPVSYLSISSASHPFFTGSKQLVDSEGRVEKFKKRFGKGFSQHNDNLQTSEVAQVVVPTGPVYTKGQNELKLEKKSGKKAPSERKSSGDKKPAAAAKPAAKAAEKPKAKK